MSYNPDNYTTGPAKLIFTGLTMKQAKCFAEWYEGQAEQDTTWFEEQDVLPPQSNVKNGKYMVVDEEAQTVTCQLHTYSKPENNN